MTDYPSAIFDPPVPLPKLDSWHWRRKFRCPDPTCARDRAAAGQRGRRVLGWQQIQKGMHLQWRADASGRHARARCRHPSG